MAELQKLLPQFSTLTIQEMLEMPQHFEETEGGSDGEAIRMLMGGEAVSTGELIKTFSEIVDMRASSIDPWEREVAEIAIEIEENLIAYEEITMMEEAEQRLVDLLQKQIHGAIVAFGHKYLL